MSEQSDPLDPSLGVLLPSPKITHTHAIGVHPFNPNAFLTENSALTYLPEHAIAEFPVEQQAILYAGQSIVVDKMAKMRFFEMETRRVENLAEIELKIHQNQKVKDIDDFRYWRQTLGWAGGGGTYKQKQCFRYTTFTPGRIRLLKGVMDKYVWDHQLGEWKHVTQAGVQEVMERQNWIFEKLKSIDAMRYETMAQWKRTVEEKYTANLSKKRKREIEGYQASQTQARESQSYEDLRLKKSKTISFDNGAGDFTKIVSKSLTASIEPLQELRPSEIPKSQITTSSVSTSFSVSPDANHEVRSEAPEPESPTKREMSCRVETTAQMLQRYSFILEIPTTDGFRVKWIKFLEKYQWNKSMISALRKFFMADESPSVSQTALFLEKLKAVCATVEAADSYSPGERKYRLLWDKKVTFNVAEAGVEIARPNPRQPTWIGPPAMPNEKRRTLATQSQSNLIVSPTESQVREAATAEKINSAMKSYVQKLTKNDPVNPPCDRCKELSLECRINKTSCKMCADSHNRCHWNNIKVHEIEELGLLGVLEIEGLEKERSPMPAAKGQKETMPRRETRKGNAKSSTGGKRKRMVDESAVNDLPEDEKPARRPRQRRFVDSESEDEAQDA